MAKKQKLTNDEQDKADMEKIQKRVEGLLPTKDSIPASISIQQADELKARISELEEKLLQKQADERTHLYQTSTLDSQLAKQRASHPASEKDSQQAPGTETILKKIQRFFLAPVFPNDLEKTQAAKVLYQIITVVWGLPILLIVIMVLNPSGRAEVIPPAIVISTILLILMAAIRNGWVGFANIVLTAMIVLVFGYADFNNAGNIQPSTLIIAIAIIMSGLLLGKRAPLAIAALIAVSHGVIVYLETQGVIQLNSSPALGFENIIITGIMILMIGFLFQFVISRLQLALDQARKDEKELQISNRELQDFSTSMEQRVADRTRDIELAAEVGRSIAEKVENVSVMLTDATEMIRSRFNLYYTQVYLLDPSGQTITLHAGTGNVGRQLLQRGHHLPISSSSLNGRAVAEKKPVIVADTEKSSTFLPNSLLPNTRSEMAIPLLVGDKVLGVLDMQSETPDALNEENVAAFQVLAGQLSVAIQNATLFTQSEEALKQLEENVRQNATTGWQDFLNGTDRGEKIGYVFDLNEVKPIERKSKTKSENALSIPITVTGATVGSVQVAQDEREWTSNEVQVVQATADQLAQHIESLRLLSQAEKYRQEAEQTTRRLTREGWEGYLQTRNVLAAGYSFNPNEIKTEHEDFEIESETHSLPITVRDESIGELTIAAENINHQAMDEIFSAVVTQLGDHIENLRLLEETEQQRADADKLYEIGQKISLAKDRQEIVAAVAENLGIPQINRAVLMNYEYGESGEVENLLIAANWYSGHGAEPTPLGRRYPAKVFTTINQFTGTNPGFVGDAQNDDRIDASSRDVFQAQNIRAFISLPLWNDVHQVGNILLQSEDVISFTGKELLPYLSIIQQVTNAFENQDLFGQTQKRAEQLTALNRVMTVANTSTDLQFILRTATDEFRNLMQASSAGILLLDEKGESLTLTTESYASADMPSLVGRSMPVASNPATNKSIMSGDTVLVPNAQTDPILAPIHAVMKLRNIQSVLVTPLFSRNKIIGVFSVDTNDPNRRFDSSDIALIETLAKQMASAIESIQLFDETKRRAADLSTVAAVSTAASTVLDPDKLLQSVVDLTKERFNVYHTHIYLADDAWNTLLLAAGAGEVGRQMVDTGHAIQMNAEKSLVARASRERKSIIVNDVLAEEGFLPNPMLPETRAEMAVPMIAGDKVIGVFDVQADKVGNFTEEDANIYTTLASQVAVALQNARLYVEQAATVTQLRELDRLKSSFLANMSHELRTPLNSILGFADVMLEELDGPLTENMNNDLGLIHKNGQHLLHLINDVLDMAKIDSGKMNLNVEKFNLQQAIEEVVSITSPLASEKNIAVLIEPDSDREVNISADKIRLRQVMINLINNSIKFTEKGQISVRVTREENNVLISVKDTGIGIPTEQLESVFLEFTQVDTSTTRKVGGTGLGLPISRRLINMHSGRLWAESTGVDGEGSTFYIYLPIESKIKE